MRATPEERRADASVIIDTLLNSNASITPRQWIVIRFWGKAVHPEWGRKHVSAWMDEWYAEDPDRQLAWEIFKEESGDYGVAQDHERVSLGAGDRYLARVKNIRTTKIEAPAGSDDSSSGVGIICHRDYRSSRQPREAELMKLFAIVFAAVLAAGLVLFGFHRCSVANDKAVAEWEASASESADRLKEMRYIVADQRNIELFTRILETAEMRVKAAPSGARVSALRRQIDFGMDYVNEWRAGRGLALEYPQRPDAQKQIDDFKRATAEANRLRAEAKRIFAEANALDEVAQAHTRAVVADPTKTEDAKALLELRPRIRELRAAANKLLDEADRLSP